MPNEGHPVEYKGTLISMWDKNECYDYFNHSAPFMVEARKVGYVDHPLRDCVFLKIFAHGEEQEVGMPPLNNPPHWDPNTPYRFRMEWGQEQVIGKL